MHHAGQGSQADISATIWNHRIAGLDPYSFTTLGAIPLWIIDPGCNRSSFMLPSLREIRVYDVIQSWLVIDYIGETQYCITSHDEESGILVNLHTGEVVLTLKGDIALNKDVEPSTALGSLSIATTSSDNVSCHRG